MRMTRLALNDTGGPPPAGMRPVQVRTSAPSSHFSVSITCASPSQSRPGTRYVDGVPSSLYFTARESSPRGRVTVIESPSVRSANRGPSTGLGAAVVPGGASVEATHVAETSGRCDDPEKNIAESAPKTRVTAGLTMAGHSIPPGGGGGL